MLTGFTKERALRITLDLDLREIVKEQAQRSIDNQQPFLCLDARIAQKKAVCSWLEQTKSILESYWQQEEGYYPVLFLLVKQRWEQDDAKGRWCFIATANRTETLRLVQSWLERKGKPTKQVLSYKRSIPSSANHP